MALDENQRKAARLIAVRGPGTDKDDSYTSIAEAVGVSTGTLYNWRQDPEFTDEIRNAEIREVKESLFDKAVNGDTQAMKYFLGRYEDNENPMDKSVQQLFDMGENEIADVKWRLYDAMKGKKRPEPVRPPPF